MIVETSRMKDSGFKTSFVERGGCLMIDLNNFRDHSKDWTLLNFWINGYSIKANFRAMLSTERDALNLRMAKFLTERLFKM